MYSRKDDLESNRLKWCREKATEKDTALIHIAVYTIKTIQTKEVYHVG